MLRRQQERWSRRYSTLLLKLLPLPAGTRQFFIVCAVLPTAATTPTCVAVQACPATACRGWVGVASAFLTTLTSGHVTWQRQQEAVAMRSVGSAKASSAAAKASVQAEAVARREAMAAAAEARIRALQLASQQQRLY